MRIRLEATLHQRVKFIIDDQLVTILAEDEEEGSLKVKVVQHVESGKN